MNTDYKDTKIGTDMDTKKAPDFSEALERKTRLELATPTLARLCSTN